MNRRVAVLTLIATALVVAVALNVQWSDAEPSRPPALSTPEQIQEPTAEAPEPPTPPVLLPNMRSLNASDLQVTGSGGTRRLRFAASLANLGPGPLLLDPRPRLDCPPQQIAADQLIHADANADGAFQRSADEVSERRRAGCMLIHPDPDHDHWHFDAMASYVLADPAGQTVAARNKVSFCLRDNERVSGADVVVPRAYFGECGRRLVQGISPGWVDVYSADLAGQSLRLPPRLNGVHCLTLSADPRHRIVETDETDNSRTIAIRLGSSDVRRISSTACARA